MKRMLFVEPSETAKKIFAAVLKPRENQWDLTFVSSAEEALEANASNPFDIMVALNHLPGQSGSELFSVLKDISPGTIRFLLVEESEKTMFRTMIGDAQQVLVKPLELKPFIKQVNRALSLRSVVSDPAILKLLGNADIPPLPRVFLAVTQKLRDLNAPLSEVASIISEDIVLSSKVLKLANSALFNLRTPAGTINHAVSLLGSNAVSSLVFSQGIADSFKGSSETERLTEELNRHSVQCAELASNILSSWNASRGLIDKIIFCGIAHDLGKLVLAKYVPEKWKEIELEYRRGERTDVEIEHSVLGISHCEIAAYLLAVWGFPNDQILAIAFHHEPSKIDDRESGLLCALHLAENICDTSLHGQRLDWDYLEGCRITKDDVEALKMMIV